MRDKTVVSMMTTSSLDTYRSSALMIGGPKGLEALEDLFRHKIESFLYLDALPSYQDSLEHLIEKIKTKDPFFKNLKIYSPLPFLFALRTGQHEAAKLLAHFPMWKEDTENDKKIKIISDMLAKTMVYPCGPYRQEIATILLKRGAAFTRPWQKCIYKNKDADTILRCGDLTEPDSYQISLLSYLAANNRLDVLNRLNESNELIAFIENQKNKSLEEAIFAAVENGHIEMYQFLMTKREPNSVARKNGDGQTPALVAAANNQIPMLEYLLSKSPKTRFSKESIILEDKDVWDNNLAHLAAKNGHVAMLNFLFSLKSSLLKEKNFSEKTPTDLAFKFAPFCAIEYLISLLKIKLKDAIKLAIKNGLSYALKGLLEKDKKPVDSDIIECLCCGSNKKFPTMLRIIEQYQHGNHAEQLRSFWHSVMLNSISQWKLHLTFLYFSRSLFLSTDNPLNMLQDQDDRYTKYYIMACILCPVNEMVDPEKLEGESLDLKEIIQPENEFSLWDYAIIAPHHDWFDFLSPLNVYSMVLDLVLKPLFDKSPIPDFSPEKKIELLRSLRKEYLRLFPEGIFSMADFLKKITKEPLLLVSEEFKTFLKKIGKEPLPPIVLNTSLGQDSVSRLTS